MSYRLLFCFLTMLALCCILGWFWISFDIESAPHASDPSTSHVMPSQEKGGLVHLTLFEVKYRYGFVEAAVIIGLIGIWVGERCDWSFRRKELN
jgi:hypothetical protein